MTHEQLEHIIIFMIPAAIIYIGTITGNQDKPFKQKLLPLVLVAVAIFAFESVVLQEFMPSIFAVIVIGLITLAGIHHTIMLHARSKQEKQDEE
ncbi:hypothetical protein [uncultured Cardiobacterium sp.]|jgi:hypothetical protein|uniref:hypothetical protein n=1 Tax=uncultured Cardiobacterium sp. TaxID=417619 RepID=UPI00260D207C|nr:hypothetical protein [uncultured Cardiobacterium sp.]